MIELPKRAWRGVAAFVIDSRAAENHRRNKNLTDFLTEYGVVVALVCAGAAVIYGLLVTQRLLAKSPGNDRMREISGAVQEGAQAYLSRQYTIIAAVAVPIAILLLSCRTTRPRSASSSAPPSPARPASSG